MFCRNLLEAVNMALFEIRYQQEKMDRDGQKGEKAMVRAAYIAAAGLPHHLSREQQATFSSVISSPLVPEYRRPLPDRPPSGGPHHHGGGHPPHRPGMAPPPGARPMSGNPADASLMNMARQQGGGPPGHGMPAPPLNRPSRAPPGAPGGPPGANGVPSTRRAPPPPPTAGGHR